MAGKRRKPVKRQHRMPDGSMMDDDMMGMERKKPPKKRGRK